MKAISIMFTFLFLFSSNAFALVASDVDMSQAVSDITIVVTSVISFLVLLFGYKKTMSLLGR